MTLLVLALLVVEVEVEVELGELKVKLWVAPSLPCLPGRQVIDGVSVGEHGDGGGVASSVRQGGGRELYEDGVHTVCLTVCKF